MINNCDIKQKMIYPVYVYGSGILRQAAKPVEKDHPELNRLIEDMFETMYASEGVGLAAPQIGQSIRMFVVDASPFAEDEPALEGFKKVFINPEIYERTGEQTLFSEGCLSIPGIHEEVLRESEIRIRYTDNDFTVHDEAYGGMAARIIQHEYDHLEGKMFVDHLSPLRKSLLKSKLFKITKGDHKASYRCKMIK